MTTLKQIFNEDLNELIKQVGHLEKFEGLSEFDKRILVGIYSTIEHNMLNEDEIRELHSLINSDEKTTDDMNDILFEFKVLIDDVDISDIKKLNLTNEEKLNLLYEKEQYLNEKTKAKLQLIKKYKRNDIDEDFNVIEPVTHDILEEDYIENGGYCYNKSTVKELIKDNKPDPMTRIPFPDEIEKLFLDENNKLQKKVRLWISNKEECIREYGHISNWDTSKVTDMSALFNNYSSFNDDIGNWDVSNVTNMNSMFKGAKSFNQDIGNWDVSKVESMSYMFNESTKFNQDIGYWNVSNVKDMKFMFSSAISFDQDIGYWDVNNVENMSHMFYNAKSFNQDISNWNVSNVKDMSYMFFGAKSFNQDIGIWDVGNVKNMSHMFKGATSFNQDISGWNIGKNIYNKNDFFNINN